MMPRTISDFPPGTLFKAPENTNETESEKIGIVLYVQGHRIYYCIPGVTEKDYFDLASRWGQDRSFYDC